ncbi:FHA domain-containing protein [Promicromonospora panici]|uniref:FHA domain-containing protein n=1 Tax=Promicromonospora panici TaxID=2219658 RepID=UPI00101DDB9A|nr:FHA domain-containing protein [Promicromonospora panici]
MTVTCPEGHASQATDYCDVCGTPIPAGAASAAQPGGLETESGQPGAEPGGSGAETGETGPVTCPNCGDLSPAGSLFCENCGYDFTTGTPAPPPAPASGLDLGDLGATQPPGRPVSGPAPPTSGAVSPPGPAPSTGAPPPSSTGTPTPSAGGGLSAPPVPGDDAWVAEIWVDPDWYAHERPEDPMPSAGLPGLVTLRQRSLLVGRPSQSRGIRPDVDCGSDPGVSRRHCQLTTDGQRWWVEDLGSSNGTFVAPAGDPLPDNPLTQGVRKEIEEGDRIFIGAWTRLVIRKALPGEV